MKLIFLYFSMILFKVPAGSSFYDIRFESLDGSTITTAAYQGKKVVVAVVSNSPESIGLIRYLDSAQRANVDVRIVAIPTDEFDQGVTLQSLKEIKKNIDIVITKPLKMKKANNSLQHPLFAWLTQSKENGHFNQDVEGAGQIFIVSARGTLYSVLGKGTPIRLIGKIINQPFND